MPLGLTLNIAGGGKGTDNLLRQTIDAMSEGKINKIIGVDLVSMTQSHLRSLDSARANPMGGDRTHYYGTAAKLTRALTTQTEIRVQIGQIGMGLHYFGGTVRPVVADFLTIPACAEAYGHRAREFSDLHVEKYKGGMGMATLALVQNAQTEIRVQKDKRKGKAGQFRIKRGEEKTHGKVFFWLVKSATIKADTSIIPTESAFYGQARVTLNRVLSEIKSGSVGLS